MTRRILLAVVVFSLTSALNLHAELDGNLWLKASDDFKVGFSIGLTETLRTFAPDEKPSEDAPKRYELMWYFHDCGVKKHLTWPQVEAAINGYITNHREERAVPLNMLAFYSLATLCGPSP